MGITCIKNYNYFFQLDKYKKTHIIKKKNASTSLIFQLYPNKGQLKKWAVFQFLYGPDCNYRRKQNGPVLMVGPQGYPFIK